MAHTSSAPLSSSKPKQQARPAAEECAKVSSKLSSLSLSDTQKEREKEKNGQQAHRLWADGEEEHPEGCMCWSVEAQYPPKGHKHP
ncbi:uncharacterized protein K452DRAFT_302759 [Aplosporella prunicola CBS 121167]|uniref:Uncharacterized protein n=1 Tax=Aplosporella prunicola CBS 121167 TaxID=1176127 RepID=A0A6A6AYU0_9PEZI|nr:uncharacterized protein K452DRAFT_302759 [Aplosporella prunicola CBS 121167]KAF2136428.1 hypothetical protein K452DRAFT_302759 [Aplosporella prunicola CBS 121167]